MPGFKMSSNHRANEFQTKTLKAKEMELEMMGFLISASGFALHGPIAKGWSQDEQWCIGG
jgi:hypothetical protein